MPGQLKKAACCPVCGDPLALLSDLTNSDGVRREFFHDKRGPKARRRRRCVKVYADFKVAQRERRALEVRRAA